MITQTRPRSSARLVSTAAIVALAAIAGWWFLGRPTAQVPPAGLGSLTVAGGAYDFQLTTCSVSDTDFAAAGSGVDDGEVYWITASGSGLDIMAGTESGVDQAIDGQLWLASDDHVAWSVEDGVVRAEAPMSDHRSPGSDTSLGVLEVRCGDGLA